MPMLSLTYFQLSNMFNPTTETGKGWDGDIRDDVILEVSFYSFITEISSDSN